ncbi:MAG: DNA polymerase III subunit delta [Candidatus Omnitrophica bacterium]|nr:DNA polymerase III subunit delta [Candidatus Omnitrophota bacterium]
MVNLKSGVFLFVGQQNYLKEKALKELRSRLLNKESSELDYRIFYGGENSVRDILDCATTIPFSSAIRLVVVKDAEKISSSEVSRLLNYIKNPPAFTCLVLDSKSDFALKGFSAMEEYLKIIRFDDLSGPELSAWVRRYVSSLGKKIEDPALELLMETQHKNLSVLEQEVEKLIAHAGEGEFINERDVEEVVGKGLAGTAFDLLKFVREGNLSEAIRLMSDLTASGKKAYEIVGVLCWHFKNILKAKTLQVKGASDYSIAEDLRVGRRYRRDFFKEVRELSISQIKNKLKVLLEADLNIKRSKFDPRLVLEFSIIRLCLG